MRQFIIFFLSPFNWYLIIFIVVLFLYARKKHRDALRLFLAGIVILLLTSTSFIPTALMKGLEYRYQILNTEQLDKQEKYYIYVNGAGFSDMKDLPATQRIDGDAMGRLIEGIRVQKELPGSILVVAGDNWETSMVMAEVYANAAYSLGADSILQLGTAKNTLGEAKALKDTIGSDNNIIVATSAMHMPRSMYHFEAAGFIAIAAPTNFKIKEDTKKYFFEWRPGTNHINHMADALKEYVGLFVARIEKRKLQ